MTYTADSPIMGTGIATAADIQAWLSLHAPDGAAYCKLAEAPIPTGFGRAIIEECTLTGINSDLFAAQVAKESAYVQSQIARDKRNYAGLGAVNSDPLGGAITFDTPRAGLHAQASHLLTYIQGEANQWREDDPRYSVTIGSDLFGKARVLRDLEQHWAWSPTEAYAATPENKRYGAGIANLANQLANFAQQRQEEPATMNLAPSQSDIGYPVEVLWATADIGPSRPISAVHWFVMHKTQGSRPGDLQVLRHSDPAQASVHVWIAKSGGLVVIIDIRWTSWTCGNQGVDEAAINVELEGYVSEPTTEHQYRAAAAFFRWCQKQGMPVPPEYVGRAEKPGIIGHCDVGNPSRSGLWGGISGHTDPGPLFDWGKLVAYITDGKPVPTSPTVDETPFVAPTGKKIERGFLNFWRSLDTNQLNVRLLGWPMSDEFVAQVEGQPQEFTYQIFERAVLTWRGGSLPPWDITTVLNKEAQAARSYAKAHGLL